MLLIKEKILKIIDNEKSLNNIIKYPQQIELFLISFLFSNENDI